MNSKEALTWDEYTQQKANNEFADYLTCTWNGQCSKKQIKCYMEILGEKMGAFICKQGYKPSDKAEVIIQVPSGGSTADPFNPFMYVGGKSVCELTATKDQYVMYASEIIDELKGECKRQIEKTWRDRLEKDLLFMFYEKYELGPPQMVYDEADAELEERFIEKRTQLIGEIESLVENFTEVL